MKLYLNLLIYTIKTMSNVKKTYFSRTIEISLRRAHLIEFDVRSFSDYSVATPNYA